jgi:molecular chaperone GrpE
MSQERPEERHADASGQEPAPGEDTQNAAAIETLRREVEENWNKYLRAAAELDNLRKRSARDVELARKFGAEKLAQALLPVRDSLDAGLGAADNADPGTLLEGLRATLRLLDHAFTTAGVQEISPLGQPFDPTKHEALTVMPAAGVAPNTVIEVVQKGYELNDRLLRAAKVIVARSPDEAAA